MGRINRVLVPNIIRHPHDRFLRRQHPCCFWHRQRKWKLQANFTLHRARHLVGCVLLQQHNISPVHHHTDLQQERGTGGLQVYPGLAGQQDLPCAQVHHRHQCGNCGHILNQDSTGISLLLPGCIHQSGHLLLLPELHSAQGLPLLQIHAVHDDVAHLLHIRVRS